MNIKASGGIKWVTGKVGCGYVYGAKGDVCTVNFLKQMNTAYGEEMGDGYFQRNGDFSKGRCAKWLNKPTPTYDCSGLIACMQKALSGVKQDISAQGLYSQCKTKGTIKNMPAIPGTLVFMYQSNKGRVVHVGMYIGNGRVVESRGVDYGVVITKLADRAWTHWGQEPWIEYDINPDGTKITTGTETDSGDNSTEKSADIEMLVTDMLNDGLITGKDYWLGLFEGKEKINLKYLQIAFQRATAKI